MDTVASQSILTAIIAALLGGVGAAFVTYVFARPKTRAEIAKLRAETEEISLRINAVANISATTSYKSGEMAERIIYSSSNNKEIGYDFSSGMGQHVTKVVDGIDTQIGNRALGDLSFETDGILNIERTNTEGRFETWLQRYSYDGKVNKIIPKEPQATQRVFRVSFEARAMEGQHTLRFVFKDEQTNKWLASAEKSIVDEAWRNFDLYLPVSQARECRLRIDDLAVSRAPSSLQIRKIVLAEKTA